MELIDIGMAAAKVIIIVMMILNIIPLLIWMERKGAAYIQDRRGPNRASVLGTRLGGLWHSLADVIKLITKGETSPREANRTLFILAPMIAIFIAVVVLAVIPFADPVTIGGMTLQLQIVDLQSGLLFVFAFSSLAVYALLLAGWASGGKFSLLGALRSSSQMMSYELSMGLSVVALFLWTGSFRLNDIVALQGFDLLNWHIVKLPLAFLIFFVALFAETNRLPFDLPEGESELAAGYHTEYSSMSFAIFFMAEYVHIVVGSLLITMLFFGGWHLPFISSEMLATNASLITEYAWIGGAGFLTFLGLFLIRHASRKKILWGDLRDREGLIFGIPALLLGMGLGGAYLFLGMGLLPEWGSLLLVFLIQLTTVLVKTIIFCSIFIWVRWTLPRFRYDQLMRLGWKTMIPLALVNIVVAGVMIVVRQ